MNVQIHEQYHDFEPPVDFRASVERMITWLPESTVAGLETVVITNLSNLNLRKRRFTFRKRKLDPSDCGGLYHYATRNAQAWIELFADNLIPRSTPKWLLGNRFVQDACVSQTLFHEIGHHLDARGARERDPEAAAERWRKQLTRSYFHSRYRLVLPLFRLLRMIFRSVWWVRAKMRAISSPAR